MLFTIVILLIAAFLGGLIAYKLKSTKNIPFKSTLTFAGSYLFAITIIHVLPELFESSPKPFVSGIFVLLGFYLQQLLEYFSAGAEHGHLHPLKEEHHHEGNQAIGVVIALSIHAFLEGTILGHPPASADHNNLSLLTGVVLHKLPAAFALMTILICYFDNSKKPIIYLTIFAIASPLGVIVSTQGAELGWLTNQAVDILFALVAGGFLHISTTIVFEGSPGHKLNKQRLLYGLAGAVTAILFEFLQ